jgi:predicted small lipoprotein YifL
MIKKTICLLLGLGLLAACEEKSTTVTPPAEKNGKSESNTTIINKQETPAPETKTETKTETNVNVNPSPSP